MDPTTLDTNIRLVRKESNRGGSSGGPSIFLPSNISSFEQYATAQTNTSALKNALKSPPSVDLSSTQVQTGESYPAIIDKDTSVPPQILFSEPKTKKRGRHLEIDSVKSQNIATGLDGDDPPAPGRGRTKIPQTSQNPLPKSGWAFPKARTTSTAKKLELARSPKPLKVGAVPTSTSTETPAKSSTESQRSSRKRSATVTPSCVGDASSTDPAKKSTKLPPRSANGRFKKAISSQKEPEMKIPAQLTKRSGTANAARHNKYGRAPFVGHLNDEDKSIRKALMEDFSQDTMSVPQLSSNMISSFLDSPCQRHRQASSTSCPDTNVHVIASSASYRTPVSKRTLEAASGMLAFSGPNIDTSSTPLTHNRAKKVRIGKETGGVAMTHGRALSVSPIDASKKSRICATPKTNAAVSTPCSKFAANYTSSYDVSPSNFMPTKYTTSTNQVISPSTSKELANLLSSATDDDEILPPDFSGVLSSPGPNDASV